VSKALSTYDETSPGLRSRLLGHGKPEPRAGIFVGECTGLNSSARSSAVNVARLRVRGDVEFASLEPDVDGKVMVAELIWEKVK
jgi:hypothetical protein